MNETKRILVISDVHANFEALEAVINAAGAVDETWCLGDLVGYGPNPNECIEKARSLPNLRCIIGNHDAAVLGKISLTSFNNDAHQSVKWSIDQLTNDNIAFLESLPERLQINNVTLSHGSPRNPIWEYLLDITSARINFDHFETELCFIGHTHVALGFFQTDSFGLERSFPKPEEVLHIAGRAILNPGSVGQPRDNDVRAAYAIYQPELNTWESHRVEYNIKAVQNRIHMAGLPRTNAIRLSLGY